MLDALRGIAALLVVACHCMLVWPLFSAAYFGPSDGTSRWADALTYSPLHLFWGGQEEVVLFFVLSGFALALPYLAGRASGYGAYLVKRFFRLYIPYIAAVALAWGLVVAVAPSALPGLSPWFHRSWLQPLTAAVAVDHLLVRGSAQYNFLDGPIWSLVHEIRISLVFPLLMLLVQRLPALGTAGLVAAFYLGGGALLRDPWTLAHVPVTYLVTVQYTAFFVLGAGLAAHRAALTAWIGGLGRWPLAALAVGALFLFNIRWNLPAFEKGTDFLTALGAGMLVLLALGVPRLRTALESPGLRWLGRVSYSLYLTHMLVLLTLVHTLGRVLPLPLVVALVPPTALLVAHLAFRLIEAPSRAWGRRLAAGLEAALGQRREPFATEPRPRRAPPRGR